jgi:thiol-disulfide isomerase/thioredoxin
LQHRINAAVEASFSAICWARGTPKDTPNMTLILARKHGSGMTISRSPLVAALLAALAIIVGVAGTAQGQSGSGTGSATAKKAAGSSTQKTLEVVDAERYLAHVAERRGKPLMVTFWATWCEPCRDEFPMVNELVREYKPKGLAMFGMNMDDDAEESLALRFMAKTQPVFVSYRKKPGKEEEFINRVNPKWTGVMPVTFLYTPDGRLMGQIVGEQPRQVFVSAIEKLLALSAQK